MATALGLSLSVLSGCGGKTPPPIKAQQADPTQKKEVKDQNSSTFIPIVPGNSATQKGSSSSSTSKGSSGLGKASGTTSGASS